MLRKGDPGGTSGHRVPEVFPQVVDAGALRAESREKGRARRITDGLLAIGPFENEASRREPVEIRSHRDGIAIGTDGAIEVVRDDEENVGLLRRVSACDAERDEGKGESLHGLGSNTSIGCVLIFAGSTMTCFTFCRFHV